MEEKKFLSCADCHTQACEQHDEARYPEFCLTKHETKAYEKAIKEWDDPENRRIALAASKTEIDGYLKQTRVEEIIRFAHNLGAKKVGIATCIGLIRETRTLTELLRINGFEVVVAACKVGSMPKADIGLPKEHDCTGAISCNPIMQAEVMNEENVDLALIMGLCVGHDSLFIKHCKCVVTSVVTKDRVTCHNPASVLYQIDNYYKKLKQPLEWM